EWIAEPGRLGIGGAAGRLRLDPPFDQLAERFLQAGRELLDGTVFGGCGQKDAAVGKMPLPESIECVELREAACPRFGVARVDSRRADVAEHQDIGGAA